MDRITALRARASNNTGMGKLVFVCLTKPFDLFAIGVSVSLRECVLTF